MQEKIQVLGVELDNCSAKDAMKRVVEHMEMERLNVVEMVSMNTLAHFQEEAHDESVFELFDIVLPSDRGILEAAGIDDERRLKEVDDLLFVKMIVRYLQKNDISVFIISETEDFKNQFVEYLKEEYGNLKIVGSMSLEESAGSDDMVMNRLNGAEVECILSTLLSPLEERFVAKNKSIINARVWFGFGALLREINKEKRGWQKLVQKLTRKILKREVEKQKKRGNA